MRRIVIAIALLACRRETNPESAEREPAPTPAAPTAGPAVPKPSEPGSYSDIVKSTQQGSATETRTELACASSIQVPPRPESAGVKSDEKRVKKLATLPATTLVAQATPDELTEIVWDRLMKALDKGVKLSRVEQDVWVVNVYEGEVNNGGHHQFFFNSSGDGAIETRDALVRLQRSDVLEIYECALTAFPDGKPDRDRARRSEQLARWGERQFELFSHLDSAFYASDTFTPALDRYIRAHIAEMPNVQKPLR